MVFAKSRCIETLYASDNKCGSMKNNHKTLAGGDVMITVKGQKGGYQLIDLKKILESLDGREFILMNDTKKEVLSGKADIASLSLELNDANGKFRGLYITDQLPFMGTTRFNKAIRIF